MSTHSLLQVSLDQTISREELEEASDAAPSIARADCAIMHRERFGILISGISQEEAAAFQSALKQRGFPTELVDDEELPVLHEAFTIQKIEFRENSLEFTDMMGREQTRPMGELVFVAGGFLTQNKIKSSLALESDSARGQQARQPVLQRQYRFEDVPEFRLDFFFTSPPNRLRAAVSAETMMFFRGRPLRLRDTALLLGAMMDLREMLPDERVGQGLKRSDTKNAYPSLRCYENEIRWQFHRLESSD